MLQFCVDCARVNCSFQSEAPLCGVGGLGSDMLLLLAFRRDMTSHLVSLGISGKRGRGKSGITELELIQYRAGLFGTVNELGRNSGHDNLSQT